MDGFVFVRSGKLVTFLGEDLLASAVEVLAARRGRAAASAAQALARGAETGAVELSRRELRELRCAVAVAVGELPAPATSSLLVAA